MKTGYKGGVIEAVICMGTIMKEELAKKIPRHKKRI